MLRLWRRSEHIRRTNQSNLVTLLTRSVREKIILTIAGSSLRTRAPLQPDPSPATQNPSLPPSLPGPPGLT